MIKLFRNIRKNITAKCRFRQYTLYAIGEIVLVVIGILIALQINTWKISVNTKKLDLNTLIDMRSMLFAVDFNESIGSRQGQ